jgi:hypothetical protein
MSRNMLGKRVAVVWAVGILLGTVGGRPAAAQGTAPGLPTLKPALASAARVEVLDSAGTVLRTANGTLVKEGVIVQTSALDGSSVARITARDGQSWESSQALATNGLIGLSLLQLPVSPPGAIAFAPNASYQAGSRIFLLNGPGGGPDSLSARIYENFTLRGAPDLCPIDRGIAGAAPAVDATGRFLGVACDLSEGTLKFGYVVPAVSVQVLVTTPAQPQSVASLGGMTAPGFEDAGTITGLLFRGVALTQCNQLDNARHYLGLASAGDASPPEAHFWTGRVLFAQEQYRPAAAAFQRAAAGDPSYRMAWHMAGAALHQAGDYAEAEKMYRKALEVKPDAADTYCNLGGAYFALQRPDDAAAAFRKSIEIDPRYAQGLAWINLAMVLNTTGRRTEAEKVHEDLARINPEWAQRLRDALDGKH